MKAAQACHFYPGSESNQTGSKRHQSRSPGEAQPCQKKFARREPGELRTDGYETLRGGRAIFLTLDQQGC